MRPVLLTRPLTDSRRMADDLAEDGIETLIWPLTRIEPVEARLPHPLRTDALVVTSAHGIRAFAALSARRDLPVLAVGEATARVARELGFPLSFAAPGNSEALATLALQSGFHRFLYPRGRDVATDLAGTLRAKGKQVTEVVVYRTAETGQPPAPIAAALRRGSLCAVSIWSARNAGILARWLSDSGTFDLTRTSLVAISEKAAIPLKSSGFGHITVVKASDAAGMLQTIRQIAQAAGG